MSPIAEKVSVISNHKHFGFIWINQGQIQTFPQNLRWSIMVREVLSRYDYFLLVLLLYKL
jgi:hypothetical protein